MEDYSGYGEEGEEEEEVVEKLLNRLETIFCDLTCDLIVGLVITKLCVQKSNVVGNFSEYPVISSLNFMCFFKYVIFRRKATSCD